MKKNIINTIIVSGMPIVSAIVVFLKFIGYKIYAQQCSELYGVDRRYFVSMDVTERSIFYFAVLFLIILYPAIVIHIFRKNKTWKPIAYICLVVILFCQTLVYVVNSKEEMLWDKKVIIGLIVVGFASDAVIADLMIKIFFSNSEITIESLRRRIYYIAIGIYVISAVLGVITRLNVVEKIKTYEIINNEKAIITEYNNKFVVMDCYIEGEDLILIKGNYTIEDLAGEKIKRKKYKTVRIEER